MSEPRLTRTKPPALPGPSSAPFPNSNYVSSEEQKDTRLTLEQHGGWGTDSPHAFENPGKTLTPQNLTTHSLLLIRNLSDTIGS